MSFTVHRDELPSGLPVVTVETPHLHSAMVTVYVRIGSRYESAANSGVSHLLEHLFFRGSRRFRDTVRMNARVEAVGGNLNGVTMRDLSYYYTPVHPSGVPVALEVLGDMLTRPRLSHLELEKEIILEEMLDEVDEAGRDIDTENLTKQARFGRHPLGLKIAGTAESVRALTQQQVEDHFRRAYVSGNVVVAVAGPVNHRAVLGAATRAFRGLPPGPRVQAPPAPAPPPGPTFRFVELDESQTSFRLSFPTVAEDHDDFTALGVLRRVLDDGLSSRLPYNVVERLGLAYSVGASLEGFDDCGSFDVDGACAPGKVAATVQEVLRTLGTLARGQISGDEVRRAQRRSRLFLETLQDSPGDLVGWFAAESLFRTPESFASRLRKIEKVTRGDLIRVARRYLTRRGMLAVAVGPRTGRQALKAVVLRARGLPRGQ